VRDSFGREEVSSHFLQGVDVYVLCVCGYALTRTLHVWFSDVSPSVGTTHLESPEEIQMYCSDRHVYIYICWATGRILGGLPFYFLVTCFSFSQKKASKKM